MILKFHFPWLAGFDSPRYQTLWEAVGVERGPPSLVSTTEELLEEKVVAAVGIRHADHATSFYPQKVSLTSPTSGYRSVGIVLSRT
jgi:hypothetical protein